MPALGWTQGAAPGAAQVDSATEKALVKLGGQLMVEGKAYEYDRKLADDIGPRLTGSDNYMKAAAWAVDEFKKMGLQNVHEENWEITAAWEPEVWATGEILDAAPAAAAPGSGRVERFDAGGRGEGQGVPPEGAFAGEREGGGRGH